MSDNLKKRMELQDNSSNNFKYNFELYEDDTYSYQDEYTKFLNSETELEDAQMMRTLRHEEIFLSDTQENLSMKTRKRKSNLSKTCKMRILHKVEENRSCTIQEHEDIYNTINKKNIELDIDDEINKTVKKNYRQEIEEESRQCSKEMENENKGLLIMSEKNREEDNLTNNEQGNTITHIENKENIITEEVFFPTNYTVVAPKHLRSLAEICKTYGKGRESVKKWYTEGAPIAFDGFSYFSEYHALQNWLVERGRRLKFDKG